MADRDGTAAVAPTIVPGAAAPAASVAAATATGMRHDLPGRADPAGLSRPRRRRRAGLERLRVYGEAAGQPTLPASIVATTLCRLISPCFGMPQAYPSIPPRGVVSSHVPPWASLSLNGLP